MEVLMMQRSLLLVHVAMLLTFSTVVLFGGRLKAALLVHCHFALHRGYAFSREIFA
jgi:hypothetical protein